MKRVSVTWKDAFFEDETKNIEDVESIPAYMKVTTIGFLMRQTRYSVVVAHEFLPAITQQSKDAIRGYTAIPRSLIIEIKELR